MTKAIELNGQHQTYNGTEAADRVTSHSADDLTVFGNGGNDTITQRYFYSHGDRLYGGAGDDHIGTNSPGIISGGAGHDTLTSAFNYSNTLYFGAADASSSDKIAIDADDKLGFLASDYGLTEGHGLIAGNLDPAYFETGNSGIHTTGHAVFFFNTKTHNLTFDPDGHGGAHQTVILHMANTEYTDVALDQIHIFTTQPADWII